MSKISNTGSYPIVTPSSDDLIVITDKSDNDATKNITVASITGTTPIPAGEIRSETVTVSAADMLSLNGGGLINLVSAKSANELIQPLSIIYYKDFQGTPYDFNQNLGISISTKQGYGELVSGFLNDIKPDVYIGVVQNGGYPGGIFYNTVVPNGGNIQIDADNSVTVTQGNSPITFYIMYRAITV